MSLQRADSISSSTVASSYHEAVLESGVLSHDVEQDDLLQTSSLEAGVFGVLFILHEKNQQRVRYHWTILKYFVTAWQIYTTILTPEYGWDIEPDSILRKCISVLSFKWFKDAGYQWYSAVLYTFAAVLTVNLVLCTWVAWSFKEQKFDYVWPIKVVRYFAYIFLQVFDMTSLSFLQLGISCSYSAKGESQFRVEVFPEYSCQRPPHIINAVLSGLLIVVFVVTALLFNMAEVEVNPGSKMPQALGHSGAAMTAFGIKALMTLVGVFLGWPKVAAVAYCVLAAWLAWEYLRWVPNLLFWINCMKTGVAFAMLSTAVLQVVLVFAPRSFAHSLTRSMAMCLGPAFLAGVIATWLRIKIFNAAVKRALRQADLEAVKPQDIYHFAHPRDVEVAARCARVWTDLYTLDKAAVHRAEEIIKAGVALFPDSAYVALVYANFMLDMLGFSQTGARQLEGVRKLNPSLLCRFMLFVRHQQATQKAASSNVGKGGNNMDLLGYVEYQRKQRIVLRHHKDALQAMATFWRILGFNSVSFTSLSRSLENIDNSVSKAESAYRVAMELYNNSPRLVRLYARFLETIKQDPWTASLYYQKADDLEETKDYNGQGPSLPDGTPMSRIDEVEKGILVVNAFGDIQVANRKLHDMFGYKKGELDGKNVTALMPPHEAKRHPAILRRYIDSGDKAPPYFRHPVLGIHRERVALTLRISVSRASGLGEDSVFIGILELLPVEPGLGRVWVTPEGVIVCCDPGFVTCFGYHPDDVIGMHLDKLLRSSSTGDGISENGSYDIWATNKANHDKHQLVQRMLANAADGENSDNVFGGADVSQGRVLHKYDFAKTCSIKVRKDPTDPSILEVRMKLISDEPQLLMVVEKKGAIRHMSGDLAKVLGVRACSDSDEEFGSRTANGDQVMLELMAESPPCCLDDFLTSPWKAMHYKYRKYIKGVSPNLASMWGCRAAINDNSSFFGPTMKLIGMHGKPVYVHVAVSSREEEGEPMHVVRMARSSLETAICERRIRIEVSLDGVVQELERHGDRPVVHANPDGLFGFSDEELVGFHLGDFLAVGVCPAAGRARVVPPDALEPDLLAEAEAAVAGFLGSSTINAGGAGGVIEGPGLHLGDVVWESLDFATYEAMVTSALQNPGISWRVKIVSPRVAAGAAALGHPARTVAVLTQHTKQAILRLDVVVPKASPPKVSPEKLKVHAELWFAEAVTGVLEIDGMGKIMGILEEEVRPPGLLFGLPKEDILGSQLSTLLRFLPGQSPVGLLTDSGIAKKSALKATSKKGKIAVKVGPVHHLDGFHRDHQPLHLAVQVVGKPGPGNPVIAVIRFTSGASHPNGSAGGADGVIKLGGPTGGPGGGGGNLMHPRGAHVCLDLGNRFSASRGSISNNPRNGAVLRLHESSATAAPAVASVGTLSWGPRTVVAPANGHHGDMQNATVEASNTGVAAVAAVATAPLSPLPPPPSFNLTSVTMPRVAGAAASGETAATAVVAAPPPPGLPGASALSAGVAGLIKARAGPVADAVDAAAIAGDTTPSASGEMSRTARHSSPEKPESPLLAGPSRAYSKRPSAAASRRVLKALADTSSIVGANATAAPPPSDDLIINTLPGVPTSMVDEEPPSRPVAGKGAITTVDGVAGGRAGGDEDSGGAADLKLETMSLAAADAGSDEGADLSGLGGVNKWVATNGKFYRNKIESVDGMMRVDAYGEEDDDGVGSFGEVSRATSSHFASPRGSLFSAIGEFDGKPHHHQHQEQQQQQQPPNPHQNHRTQQFQGPHPHQHQQNNPPYPQSYKLYNPYQQNSQHLHHNQHQHQHQQQHQYQQYPYQQYPYSHPQPHPHQNQNQNQNQHHHQYLPHSRFESMFAGDTTASSGNGASELDSAFRGQPIQQQRFRRGSFLQGSGNVMADAAVKALDAMSLDQGDDHDSDGDSDISGITGGSGGSDAEDPADYKRGKRYRKLIKIMNSPQATNAITRLRIHTMLAVIAAISIHVLSFSLIITSIKKQSHALDELAEAGRGQRYLQRALVSLRALEQTYKETAVATVYDKASGEIFAQDLLSYSNMYRETTKGLLQRNGGIVEHLFYTFKLQVWSGVSAISNTDIIESITLWDMLTRVYISAKAIFQTHGSLDQQDKNLTSLLPVQFLLRSGQGLSKPGLRPVIDALLDSAVTLTNTVNSLQLTFLLVEGVCVAGCCAVGLMYMLKSAFNQRYQLYETFLSIPIGLTRALAAQTTHLLDDESDSQSEEDDDKEYYEDGPPSANIQQGNGGAAKRKALFDESLTVFDMDSKGEDSMSPGDGGGDGGGGGSPGAVASDIITGSKARGIEKSKYDQGGLVAAAAGSQQGRQLYHDTSKMKSSSKRFKVPDNNNDSFGQLGDLSSLLTPTADPTNHTLHSLGQGYSKHWRALLCGCLPRRLQFWRLGATIQPSSLGPADPTSQPHRTLIRNSKVAKGLLSIVMVYSLLVILFYTINYIILRDVTDRVALQAVVDQNAERTYRTVFYAQELAAEDDLGAVSIRVEALRNATVALRDAYFTMRLGAKAPTVVGDNIEKFRSVIGHGLTKDSPEMFNFFYGDNSCLRLPEHLPCLSKEDPFYEVTRSGADGMMNQLLNELNLFADESMAAVVAATPTSTAAAGDGSAYNNSNTNVTQPQQHLLLSLRVNITHWRYIFRVGTIDLNDANVRISAQHIADVKAVLGVVVVLHVVLLLLLIGLFLSFLMFGYLPLLRRMEKEKRRIAEMMSQLPTELDVMRLFSTALMGSSKGAGGAATSGISHGHLLNGGSGDKTYSQLGGGGDGDGGGGSNVIINRIGSANSNDGGLEPVAARSLLPLGNFSSGGGAGDDGSGTMLMSGGIISGNSDTPAATAKSVGATNQQPWTVVGTNSGGSSSGNGKAYQNWKDILARTTSTSGANTGGVSNPSVIASRTFKAKTPTMTAQQF